jgi:ubiquinone/menaquinone biosynthesis C-methylase UbiE
MTVDPTKRFSSRVANYVKWRPSYPAGVIDALVEVCGMTPEWTIADIGSGPGNLTRLLLDFGATAIGVEPNDEMRLAGDELLKHYSNYSSIGASAEETTLPEESIDLITAGQAFHWFKVDQAKIEFQRILKQPGWVALIWNDRPMSGTPFLDAYERMLLTHSPDYRKVRHQDTASDEIIARFFAPGAFQQIVLPNEQVFDLAGLTGRLWSSSYAPLPGQPGHDEMAEEIVRIFNEHREDGVVHFLYDTRVYVGKLNG